MGTSLIGLLPQNTYSGLIKVGNNTAINTTLKTLSDGAGNDLPMQASTTAINFTGTVSGIASGVAGAIQFSNGSAFASDAANLFWDDTNNRLGVGTNSPTATAHIVGANTSSSSSALRVLNSVGQGIFSVANDGFTQIGDFTQQGYGSNLAFLRPSGSTRVTTFAQGNSNLTITNTNGNVTFQNTPVQVVGSGSTSATTSLLVQNSSGSTNLIVTDDQILKGYDNASLRFRLGGSSPAGISTRAGALCVGIIDANFTSGLQINASSGSGKTYIDGWNDGGSSQYDIIIGVQGSRTQFGNDSSESSAQVAINSTTRGFLPPRMTTTQKNAIATPAAGLEMYDSTAKSPAYYDGTNWGYTGGALQNAAGNSGTLNISFAAGNIVNLTLNANTTLAFSNAVIGTYIIQVTQGATGSNLLTYPASVKWAGGTAPTLTTTVGKTDILTFYYDGTFYYGNYSLNY